MPEEIDLNADEEAALDAAWAKVQAKGKLPPPSPLLKDGNVPSSKPPGKTPPLDAAPPP